MASLARADQGNNEKEQVSTDAELGRMPSLKYTGVILKDRMN